MLVLREVLTDGAKARACILPKHSHTEKGMAAAALNVHPSGTSRAILLAQRKHLKGGRGWKQQVNGEHPALVSPRHVLQPGALWNCQQDRGSFWPGAGSNVP